MAAAGGDDTDDDDDGALNESWQPDPVHALIGTTLVLFLIQIILFFDHYSVIFVFTVFLLFYFVFALLLLLL